MTLDLSMFGATATAESIKEEAKKKVDEMPTEESEEAVSSTTPQEEEKDTTDRSVPLLDRIDKEIGELKFATGLMGNYQMQAAATLAEMIKLYLTTPGLVQNPDYIIQKWDSNKWTFPKLWESVEEKAKTELNGKSGGVSGEIVWSWVQHFIIDEKPKAKTKPNTAYSSPSKPKAKAQKKEEPQAEQLHLDLSQFM